MSTTVAVTIPLVNPNETEALLASLHVQEGQAVKLGDLLCTLETTKSTLEVLAQHEGYIVDVRLYAGQTVQAGDVLLFITNDPGRLQNPPSSKSLKSEPLLQGLETAGLPESPDLPPGLRITQPALDLARQLGLDPNDLPAGPLFTIELLRKWAADHAGVAAEQPAQAAPFDPTAIVVYGGGGHGKSLVELLRALGCYHIAGILDDGLPPGAQILGVPVLGGGEQLAALHAQGVRLAANAVGGIGNLAARLAVFEKLADAGFACPAVVHPAAWIEPSASLAPGAQVFPHAYVGSESRIGFGCIVNTGAIVSHDCMVGDYANLSPGATLAGGVRVGAQALVGMRATVNLAVEIGVRARIGNGATVKEDVPPGGIVPAGAIWPPAKGRSA